MEEIQRIYDLYAYSIEKSVENMGIRKHYEDLIKEIQETEKEIEEEKNFNQNKEDVISEYKEKIRNIDMELDDLKKKYLDVLSHNYQLCLSNGEEPEFLKDMSIEGYSSYVKNARALSHLIWLKESYSRKLEEVNRKRREVFCLDAEHDPNDFGLIEENNSENDNVAKDFLDIVDMNNTSNKLSYSSVMSNISSNIKNSDSKEYEFRGLSFVADNDKELNFDDLDKYIDDINQLDKEKNDNKCSIQRLITDIEKVHKQYTDIAKGIKIMNNCSTPERDNIYLTKKEYVHTKKLINDIQFRMSQVISATKNANKNMNGDIHRINFIIEDVIDYCNSLNDTFNRSLITAEIPNISSGGYKTETFDEINRSEIQSFKSSFEDLKKSLDSRLKKNEYDLERRISLVKELVDLNSFDDSESTDSDEFVPEKVRAEVLAYKRSFHLAQMKQFSAITDLIKTLPDEFTSLTAKTSKASKDKNELIKERLNMYKLKKDMIIELDEDLYAKCLGNTDNLNSDNTYEISLEKYPSKERIPKDFDKFLSNLYHKFDFPEPPEDFDVDNVLYEMNQMSGFDASYIDDFFSNYNTLQELNKKYEQLVIDKEERRKELTSLTDKIKHLQEENDLLREKNSKENN